MNIGLQTQLRRRIKAATEIFLREAPLTKFWRALFIFCTDLPLASIMMSPKCGNIGLMALYLNASVSSGPFKSVSSPSWIKQYIANGKESRELRCRNA